MEPLILIVLGIQLFFWGTIWHTWVKRRNERVILELLLKPDAPIKRKMPLFGRGYNSKDVQRVLVNLHTKIINKTIAGVAHELKTGTFDYLVAVSLMALLQGCEGDFAPLNRIGNATQMVYRPYA